MKKLLIASFLVVLAGCALPTTRVGTGATRPTLAIAGAPSDAVLYLDALIVGNAAQYDGSAQVLYIEEGLHTVELRRNGEILLTKKIFAANEEKRVVIYKSDKSK